MSRLTALALSLTILLCLPGASVVRVAAVPASGNDPVSSVRVRADVEFLADDLLEGREAGTRGYEIAARYAAAQLEAAGYAPGADDGTYLQQVPFIESTPVKTSLTITAKGATAEVPLPDEGVVGANARLESVEVSGEVVFVGYGVTAPDFGYDDYAGLDVKGKIVALLRNAPASLPGEFRAHYSSTEHKSKNAADHGAVAIIGLASAEDLTSFPWDQVKAVFGRPSLTWARPDGSAGSGDPRLKAVAYLNPQGAARLFAAGPITFDQAVAQAKAGKPGGVALNATVAMATQTTHKKTTSPNVVGILKGSDPALAATSVVLTAHLDHTGIRQAGDGDRINNGAYDNAVGSAIVLEVARALASGSARPKRTIVVALVTAEEKGLLGSDYFAHYPVKAAGRMVANVNLDMPVFMAASSDIVAFGAEHSSLDVVVEKSVKALGYTMSPDPMPQENIFVRSDQYSLVKQGVPAVYLMPGFKATDPAVNGQQVFGGFLAKHYHRPSDDLSLPMDLAAVERFTRANLAVARAIADDPVDPAWKPGNFFGKMFGKKKPD